MAEREKLENLLPGAAEVLGKGGNGKKLLYHLFKYRRNVAPSETRSTSDLNRGFTARNLSKAFDAGRSHRFMQTPASPS